MIRSFRVWGSPVDGSTRVWRQEGLLEDMWAKVARERTLVVRVLGQYLYICGKAMHYFDSAGHSLDYLVTFSEGHWTNSADCR